MLAFVTAIKDGEHWSLDCNKEKEFQIPPQEEGKTDGITFERRLGRWGSIVWV
jgi:hypothetical protein